jgi:VIT family
MAQRAPEGACGVHVGTCVLSLLFSDGSYYFAVRQNAISRCRVNLGAATRLRDRVPLDRCPLSPASRTRAGQRATSETVHTSGHCLVGVAAATQSDVLIAGVAGLVADAISMAAGESYHGRGGDKILCTLAEPGTGQYCSVFESIPLPNEPGLAKAGMIITGSGDALPIQRE